MPQPDPNEIQLAMRLHQQGRLEEAERAFRWLLSRFPGEPNASHMLGVLHFQRGQMAQAEPLLKESLKVADQVPQWHSNYALFCRSVGRLEEAQRHLKRSIELHPDAPESYDNLGLVLSDMNRTDDAVKAHEEAIRLRPGYAVAYHHMAQSLFNGGRPLEAIERWKKAIELEPQFADAHGSLCFVLNKIGRPNEAMPHGLLAVKLDPKNPDAHVALAISYGHKGRLEDGIRHLKEALRLRPRHLAAMINMGWLLERSNQHDQAADYSRMALRIEPNNAQAMVNLGMSLCNLGEFRESLEWVRGALEVDPEHAGARSNVLWAQHYDPDVTRQKHLEDHLQFAQHLSPKVAGKRFTHTNDRDPERPLRIAYVSPDFRRHPVATFLEPILRHHDRESFIVTCYSSVRSEDQMTATLRGLASNWVDVLDLNDEELAERIHRDGQDIAIELAGHTADTRLRAFAYKPAPVQISYLGYVNTTGVPAIDYRITDAIVDPEASSDAFYVEKLIRLPCFFCYGESKEAPAAGPLPAGAAGHVTFGSLNQSMKFNNRVLRLWATLLDRVPGSRLVLMSATSGAGAKRMRDTLVSYGVPEDRLTLLPRQLYFDYFARYNTIDIGLDPFPASGHTTTCDALWMGVPVITLPGESYVSRLCADVLTQLGLTELIARDPEQYVQIAADLAGDRARLAGLRATMRQRMQRSIIMDGPRITNDLEGAYRRVWRDYCSAST